MHHCAQPGIAFRCKRKSGSEVTKERIAGELLLLLIKCYGTPEGVDIDRSLTGRSPISESTVFCLIFFLINCWSSVVASVVLTQLCNLHCFFFFFC